MYPADYVRCRIVCHETDAVLGHVSLPPALARAYERDGLFGRAGAASALLEAWICHHHSIRPDRPVRLEREGEEDAACPGPLTAAALEWMRQEIDAVPDGWAETAAVLPLPPHLAAAVKRAMRPGE